MQLVDLVAVLVDAGDELGGERSGGTGSAASTSRRRDALRLGLVEQAERPLARLAAAADAVGRAVRTRRQARVMYSPERVSTLSRSPG